METEIDDDIMLIEEYEEQSFDDDNDDEHIIGTEISTEMVLFKPISIALASTITSLDIRSFSAALIPMLKAINRDMKEVRLQCEDLKAIFLACFYIPKVQDGVTIKVCETNKFCYDIKAFLFHCQKLTIFDANFNVLCKTAINNSHLRNINDLTIQGIFYETDAVHEKLKQIPAFLSSTFPSVKTLNMNLKYETAAGSWKWNDGKSMANIFQQLPSGFKGCICFNALIRNNFNPAQYPGFQRNGHNEYYKISPITDTLNFKMVFSHANAFFL